MSGVMKPGAVRGTVICDMSALSLFSGQWASIVVHPDRHDHATLMRENPRQAMVIEISCDESGHVIVSVPKEFEVKVWGEEL